SLLVVQLVGLLKLVETEALGGCSQLLAQLLKGFGAPTFRPIQQDANRLDPGGVLTNEAGERFQVIGGLVFLARAVPDKVVRRYRVRILDRLPEDLLGTRVVHEQVHQSRITEPLHFAGEVLLEASAELSRVFAEVAIGDAVGSEQRTGAAV